LKRFGSTTGSWSNEKPPGHSAGGPSLSIRLPQANYDRLQIMAEPIKPATVAVIAGLIAAVKLARVESSEIHRRSPRVRCAISDSVDIAQMVLAEALRRQ
jgi:hypothetical protein